MNKQCDIKELLFDFIELYRITKKETIYNVINSHQGYSICSSYLYANMRNRIHTNNIEVYYQLLNSLNKKILKKKISLDFTQLCTYIEYYMYDNCIAECQKILDILTPYKNYFYYDLMYKAVELIKKQYSNEVVQNFEEYLDYIYIFKYYNVHLRNSFYYSLFYFSQNISIKETEISLIKSRAELTEIITRNTTFLPLCQARLAMLFSKKLYIDAFELIQFIEKNLKSDNYLFNINFYLIVFVEIYNISNKSDYYYSKYCKLLNENYNKIPDKKKTSILGNEIIFHMLQKNYSKCLELIDSIYSISNKRQIQLSIFYMFCSSQLNLPVKTKFMNINATDWQDLSDKELYYYFIYSQENKKKEILDYLMILREKYVQDNERYYIFILKEELIKYCEIYGIYKPLKDFEELKYNPKSKRSLKKFKM